MTINQRNLFAGRTEYRESDYRFARTCPRYYPKRGDVDTTAGRCALLCALLLLLAVSVGVAI